MDNLKPPNVIDQCKKLKNYHNKICIPLYFVRKELPVVQDGTVKYSGDETFQTQKTFFL